MKTQAKTNEGWCVISGFFSQEDSVRKILMELLSIGVPRDLIEVVIEEADVQKYFKCGRVRKLNQTSSVAAKGALIGLILFSLISAAMIVTSSATDNQRLTWIMLLGPNVGVILGGILGLIWGFIFAPEMPERYSRLREDQGILLIARSRSRTEAEDIKARIAKSGANAVVIS